MDRVILKLTVSVRASAKSSAGASLETVVPGRSHAAHTVTFFLE